MTGNLLRESLISRGTPRPGLPTRTAINGWSVAIRELAASAAAWRQAATHIETTIDQYVQTVTTPGGTAWTGDAADTAADTAYADRAHAYRTADHLNELAVDAGRGAQNLQQLQARALDAIADAEADGFTVDDDLTVVDRTASTASAVAQRRAAAQAHQDYLSMRVGALTSTDAEIGAALSGATVDVPTDWPSDHGITAVDYTTSPPPPPDLPGDPATPAPSQIGPFPVPPSVIPPPGTPIRVEPPPIRVEPPPPPVMRAPTVQEQLDRMQRTIDDQGRQLHDVQNDAHNPTPAVAGAAIVGGCAAGAAPVAIAGAITGPVDAPLTAGACVIGGAAGLTAYLAGIWAGNAVG